MEFNGFKVFPTGEAKLSIENNILRVDNIGDSGLDGVLIKFDSNDKTQESHIINLGDLSSLIEKRGVLKTATLKKNLLGQVVTSFESFKWYDEKMKKIMVSYNPSLLPEDFTFSGTLNGETIFEINSSDLNAIVPNIDPDDPAPSMAFLWRELAKRLLYLAASAAAAYVGIDSLKDTKKFTDTHYVYEDGKLTTIITVHREDPEPFEIVVNDQTFIIDEFGIKYNMDIPEELSGNSILPFRIAGEQITGYNLSSFEIISIV